jgi:EAL domain-containing protein (putative c-di-GMP-specific phosphodiesterase class I)/GGDEF domain-containing protein
VGLILLKDLSGVTGGKPYLARQVFLYALLVVMVWLFAEVSRYFSISTNDDTSAIWPPVGIALGAVLVLGVRAVWVYAAAIGGWFLVKGYPPEVVVGLMLEQSVAVWAMQWVFRRFCKDATLIETLKETLRFYLLVPVLTLLPLSGLVSAVYFNAGYFQSLGFGNIWAFHWLAEALGVVLFAPATQHVALYVLRAKFKSRMVREDAGIWLVFMLLAGANFWFGVQGQFNYARGISYLYFPLMSWAAISGRRTTVLLMLPLATSLTVISVYYGSWQQEIVAWNALGEALAFCGVLVSMTHLVLGSSVERQQVIRFLTEVSERDSLTGALNQRGLQRWFERSRGSGNRFLMLTLCLRNFDSSRDILPETVAEGVQKWVSERLEDMAEAVADRYAVARLDNGVFTLLLTYSDKDDLRGFLDGVHEALRGQTFPFEQGQYQVQPTIGSLTLSENDDFTDAVAATRQLAREAMSTPGQPVWFGRDQQGLLARHKQEVLRLETLKSAILQNRFVLYGQEIRPLHKPGLRSKMELLVRMVDADGDIVSPGEFLPVASRFGYMADVDRWVITHAFQLVREDPDITQRIEQFSINLSGATLSDLTVIDHIAGLLQTTGLSPSQFCFEVTETEHIGDWQKAETILLSLREMGFSISLDDFGTGLASFDYLNRIPFDFVKIDGAFIRGLEAGHRNESVVEAVVLVARNREIRTIAEFVDGSEVERLLSALGVDYVQGFGIHKPAPISEFSQAQSIRNMMFERE